MIEADKKIVLGHIIGVGLLVSILGQYAGADTQGTDCNCIAEEYKAEESYPLYKQAVMDWRARKWADAMEKHQRIIEKYPSSPLAAMSHLRTGLYLKYHKLYEEAVTEFQKGISVIPDTRAARDAETSVACIYTAQGKYDDALNILREVLKKAKDWDEVKYCSYWMKEIQRRKAKEFQSTQACGAKALATVFRLKNIKTSEREISTLLPPNDIRVSMQSLQKSAEVKGLKVTGVRLTPAQLKTIETPVIALVKPAHYIVISSINEKGFTVIDPVRGERPFTISETALQKNWTGYVLLFSDMRLTDTSYALLTNEAMESTFGGVCDCCPESDNGKPPGVEGDDPPSIWVNTVNLNLVLDDIDLLYSGLGPDVEIKRTYNADDSSESVFGRSWTFNYNIYLTEEPSGDVLVNREDGKIDRFYYVDDSRAGMEGTWFLNSVCISTTCPDWSDVGETGTDFFRVTQSGNELTAQQYDEDGEIELEMTGTISGNTFNLSGSYTQTEDGCKIDRQKVIEGTVDGNSLNATVIKILNPAIPGDPNCSEMIGSGCEELHWTTGVRKISPTGYITYEPGVYDTLIKNPDGTWMLKIKKDKTIQRFNADGKLVSITDRNGNALTFGYDGNGRPITITDAAGRVATFTYGGNNKIIRITDPIGRHADYAYDANGNLIRSRDTAGYYTDYNYDEYSYMTSITTPQGAKTYIDYWFDEEYGYALRSITDDLWNSRWYGVYWASGEDDVMVTDARENTAYYDNTEVGMTGAIIDPLGNTTSFGYDIFGNRNSVKNPNGKTTDLAYDDRGNITRITDPLGNATSFTYDDKDNLIQLKDPLNRVYSYTYDANDNLTKVTDPLNKQTVFSYDSKGQLTDINDARGNTTSFAYDAKGNLISSTDPLGYITKYGYDGVGRLTSRTDAKGSVVYYSYDGLDRVTRVTYPDGIIRYNYDSTVLTSIVGKDGQTTSFEYDDLDRMSEVIYPDGGTIEYGYDQVGNRIFITYPNDKTVWYIYDEANRLTRVKDWWNNNTVYTYDPAGNLISTKNLPYGTVTTCAYDDASRLVSLKTTKSNGTTICSYQYSLDAAGNRIAISGVEPLEPNLAYADIRYTYNQDNQLLTANGTTFQYDKNGNLFSKTENGATTTYSYDYDNRLTQVLTADSTYQYKYDALGNRVAKTKGGVATNYYVDINRLLPEVLAETDADRNPISYYIYGIGLISKIYDIEYGWEDDIAYYHYDGLGNTVALTDQSSNVINKYAYTPFGELAGIEEAEDTQNPFRYVGKFGVMDDENGLLYMRARYYVPDLGRFLSGDPIWFIDGTNSYSYVSNNPNNFVDPLGLYSVINERIRYLEECVWNRHWRERLREQLRRLPPRSPIPPLPKPWEPTPLDYGLPQTPP